jgi:hypothetical protein
MNRACPCGSGYSLQVLALLRAFRFYPSRGSIIQLGPLQMLRKFLLMRKRHKVKGKGHKVKGKGHKVKNKGHKVKLAQPKNEGGGKGHKVKGKGHKVKGY